MFPNRMIHKNMTLKTIGWSVSDGDRIETKAFFCKKSFGFLPIFPLKPIKHLSTYIFSSPKNMMA